MKEISYINGMDFGVGFTTSTYAIHPITAFNDTSAVREVASAAGQSVLYRSMVASSTRSLAEQLHISAAASLRCKVLGSGSASAKANFVSDVENKQNSFTIYVIVQVTVINQQKLLDFARVKFTTDASSLLSKDPQSFINQYGNSFIYGIITGGEFLGILEIEASSASQFRQIKSDISANGNFGTYSADANGSIENSLKKITSSHKAEVKMYKDGGPTKLPDNPTPDDLIKYALSFPTEVKENAVPYSALIIPYNDIPNPAPHRLDVSKQQMCLAQLGEQRQRLLKYKADLEFAKSHPGQFPNAHWGDVDKRINDIDAAVHSLIDECIPLLQ